MLIKERLDIQRQEARQLVELKAEVTRRETALKLDIERSDRFKGFVRSEPLEQLHKDGTLAAFPTFLRHLGTLTDRFQKRLERAFGTGGFSKLQRVAMNINQETSTPIREVYTLYYSP